MSWCIYNLSNGYCPVFYVKASQEECDDCKNRGKLQEIIADRSVGVGLDRGREIQLCKHRIRRLQGLREGCCGTGKLTEILICCRLKGDVSAYGCYGCEKFEKI